MKNINNEKTSENNYITYVEYITENLDKNIAYVQYITGNLDIDELKIEEKYNYSYDIIINSKDLSPIYVIKLYNNNENHIIMINDNYEFYSVNKIKTHIKHYFRDINLNKLIQ